MTLDGAWATHVTCSTVDGSANPISVVKPPSWMPSMLSSSALCLCASCLLLQPVRGDFDAAGRLDPSSAEYWDLLDRQLEESPTVKHVSEPAGVVEGGLLTTVVGEGGSLATGGRVLSLMRGQATSRQWQQVRV